MAKVAVGLWSRPVKTKYGSLEQTLLYLSRAIGRTREFAKKKGIRPLPGKVRSVFVAPEFLFTNPKEHKSSTTALGRPDRDRVLTYIEREAGVSPSMLLIPGTIVFKQNPLDWHYDSKTMTGQTYGAKAIKNLEHAANPKPLNTVAPEKYSGYRKLPPHPTKEIDSTQAEDVKQFYTGRAEELSLAEKNAAIRQNKIDTFLIKNRTYVFFDGSKIFSYGKKCSCDDFHDDAQQGIYVPGKKEGVKVVGGLAVGVEVCYDHEKGLLKGHLAGTPLDLQIICSAEVSGAHANFKIKEGGYVLHASSEPLFTGVVKKGTPGSATPDRAFKQITDRDLTTGAVLGQHSSSKKEYVNIDPAESVDIDEGPLRLYEIDLPD